jgi:hypothetical protein
MLLGERCYGTEGGGRQVGEVIYSRRANGQAPESSGSMICRRQLGSETIQPTATLSNCSKPEATSWRNGLRLGRSEMAKLSHSTAVTLAMLDAPDYERARGERSDPNDGSGRLDEI